jgi:hypothetical protein
MEKAVERQVGDSSNQVSVSVRLAGRGNRTPGPSQRRANPAGRVSTSDDIREFVYCTRYVDCDSPRQVCSNPAHITIFQTLLVVIAEARPRCTMGCGPECPGCCNGKRSLVSSTNCSRCLATRVAARLRSVSTMGSPQAKPCVEVSAMPRNAYDFDDGFLSSPVSSRLSSGGIRHRKHASTALLRTAVTVPSLVGDAAI